MAREKRIIESNRAGFSLLELSVILAIIAVVVVAGVGLGANAIEGANRMTTQDRLTVIRNALNDYAKRHHHLPCPARRDRTPTNSGFFGDERRNGSSCTADGTGVLQITVASDSIFLGNLPTRTLGLPDTYAGDGWGNKFRYAVSARHTGETGAYEMVPGVITIRQGDSTGTNYALTTTSAGAEGAAATFVVISTGPDAKGAWPMAGTTISAGCGTSNNNDVENCDDDDLTFYDNDDVAYVDNPDSTNSFFDDYVVWGSNALSMMPMVSPIVYCPGATLNWTVAAVNCSATVPGGFYTVGVHDMGDVNGPTVGTATFECFGTSWQATPEAAPVATCTNGGAAPTLEDGCSAGNCAKWCAPCSNEAEAFRSFKAGRYYVCDKELTSTNPCMADCTYAGETNAGIMNYCQ